MSPTYWNLPEETARKRGVRCGERVGRWREGGDMAALPSCAQEDSQLRLWPCHPLGPALPELLLPADLCALGPRDPQAFQSLTTHDDSILPQRRALWPLNRLLPSSLLTPLPWWLRGKEATCSAGDTGSILGLGRSPGEGNGNPLQHSCLGNPMDKGAWWATVHGVAKSQTQLSDYNHHHLLTLGPPQL